MRKAGIIESLYQTYKIFFFFNIWLKGPFHFDRDINLLHYIFCIFKDTVLGKLEKIYFKGIDMLFNT